MMLTLRQISDAVNGILIGNEDIRITGVASFDDAGPGEITFASDQAFLKRLDETGAGAVIVPADYASGNRPPSDLSLVLSDEPKRQFFRILSLFHPERQPLPGVSPNAVIGTDFSMGEGCVIEPCAVIGDEVRLGNNVRIMAGCYIGDGVSIGNDTVLRPNVTIMERSQLGCRVIIHPGSVIGSDGFGFTPGSSGHEKITHAGFVQIDDDVEIGACNAIDRGTFGRTWIKSGVKTDNQVHIAHNVVIGRNSLLVAQVGIAGSTHVGNNVILAGKCGISGHLTIGDNAIVGPGAGVLSNVAPGTIVSGIPQMPHKIWLKVGSLLPRLPEMRKTLARLEKKINELMPDKQR